MASITVETLSLEQIRILEEKIVIRKAQLLSEAQATLAALGIAPAPAPTPVASLHTRKPNPCGAFHLAVEGCRHKRCVYSHEEIKQCPYARGGKACFNPTTCPHLHNGAAPERMPFAVYLAHSRESFKAKQASRHADPAVPASP